MEGRGCDGHEEGIEGVDLGCNILSDFDLFIAIILLLRPMMCYLEAVRCCCTHFVDSVRIFRLIRSMLATVTSIVET